LWGFGDGGKNMDVKKREKEIENNQIGGDFH